MVYSTIYYWGKHIVHRTKFNVQFLSIFYKYFIRIIIFELPARSEPESHSLPVLKKFDISTFRIRGESHDKGSSEIAYVKASGVFYTFRGIFGFK